MLSMGKSIVLGHFIDSGKTCEVGAGIGAKTVASVNSLVRDRKRGFLCLRRSGMLKKQFAFFAFLLLVMSSFGHAAETKDTYKELARDAIMELERCEKDLMLSKQANLKLQKKVTIFKTVLIVETTVTICIGAVAGCLILRNMY